MCLATSNWREWIICLTNWEKLKAAERKENGDVEKSLLDGVPDILPALTQSQEVQDRAAQGGFRLEGYPRSDG